MALNRNFGESQGKIEAAKRAASNTAYNLGTWRGQLVPGSIINPGGRRTGMSGDLLRDLDCAARIHVFGDTRRTEAVTTNSFQDPACPSPVSQPVLRHSDGPGVSNSIVSRFLPKEGMRQRC